MRRHAKRCAVRASHAHAGGLARGSALVIDPLALVPSAVAVGEHAVAMTLAMTEFTLVGAVLAVARVPLTVHLPILHATIISKEFIIHAYRPTLLDIESLELCSELLIRESQTFRLRAHGFSILPKVEVAIIVLRAMKHVIWRPHGGSLAMLCVCRRAWRIALNGACRMGSNVPELQFTEAKPTLVQAREYTPLVQAQRRPGGYRYGTSTRTVTYHD